MFGFAFRFPAGRYHATPWGRSVNEADVAWPPEPWRILRALIACYWRKGDRDRWTEDHLNKLIYALTESLPVFRLPEDAIHAHTRHYVPIPKGKSETNTLIFDAFLCLPKNAEVEVWWPNVTLEKNILDLASDLASGLGYLGRSESWVECRILTEAQSKPNCVPADPGFPSDSCRVLVPHSYQSYQKVRDRLIDREIDWIRNQAAKDLSERAFQRKVRKSFFSTKGIDTLPARLLDALAVDNADLQNRRWDRPPAAYEVIYFRDTNASPTVLPRPISGSRSSSPQSNMPTVARYLLTGRPRPRIEDAVRIGEVMRAAVMSKFGWQSDEGTGRKTPLAPWKISGRVGRNQIVRDPTHPHAFWLPEDADEDGWIDHVVVFISSGMDAEIQRQLGRMTRIWFRREASTSNSKINEWRVALEGFGHPKDFDGASRLLTSSRKWRSVTPFLASGYLKKHGYRGEVIRLLKRRGIADNGVSIMEVPEVIVAGAPKRALNFRRFRAHGREPQLDSQGALLEIKFPQAIQGPLALGYGSHFGLGMFEGR